MSSSRLSAGGGCEWFQGMLHPPRHLPGRRRLEPEHRWWQPALGIADLEMEKLPRSEESENGIRANIASFTRHHPNVMMTKAKISGNYANSTLAQTESIRLGFEEAIMLDPQGYVAECTGENLFLVRKGKIITPPVAAILEGITRDSLITLAKDLGFEVIEDHDLPRPALHRRRGLRLRDGCGGRLPCARSITA